MLQVPLSVEASHYLYLFSSEIEKLSQTVSLATQFSTTPLIQHLPIWPTIETFIQDPNSHLPLPLLSTLHKEFENVTCTTTPIIDGQASSWEIVLLELAQASIHRQIKTFLNRQKAPV